MKLSLLYMARALYSAFAIYVVMNMLTYISLLLYAGFTCAASSTISLSPPTVAPSIARSVAQGFIAFGIEGRDFQIYTGNDTSPNVFSQNMFQTFTNKTGAPVNIRIGGTSMDNTIWDPNQQQAVNFTGNLTQMGLHTNITLGASWVESFKHIPNANWTVQVPLARRNPVDNVVAFANACINAIPGGLQRVEAIEIGNEPDLYRSTPQPNTDRPSSYSPADYAAEWQTMGTNLENGIPALKTDQPRFQAGSLASGAAEENPPWHMSDVFEAGINGGGMAKLAAQHYYQIATAGPTLQGDLMNHTQTVNLMRTNFLSDANFMHTNFSNIPYILGEVGTALTDGGSIFLDQSLGTALWTADFMLYAMTIGIDRVNMQLGNFEFSAWLPTDVSQGSPEVRGNFYGHVFVADFIGIEGNLSVAALEAIPNATHPNLVGYAGYQSNVLSKIALLDLQFWQSNSSSARPSQNITISVGDDVRQVKIERLASPDGSDALQPNITWEGNLWSEASNGTAQAVRNDTTVLQVNNGTVEDVNIEASEGLLLTLMRD